MARKVQEYGQSIRSSHVKKKRTIDFFFLPSKIDQNFSKKNSDEDKIDPKKDAQIQKIKEEKELAEFFDSKLIYRHYATLFFIFLVDQSESELVKYLNSIKTNMNIILIGILDLIQVFVEALDQRFENVCELDIVFRFDEVNNILDEIVMGGMVLETNLNEITSGILVMKNYEKTSKTVSKKNKTVIKSHITVNQFFVCLEILNSFLFLLF
ncbi:hypothetical protein RFI_01941 [Reticulomyxa filosa]|uniref:AP complex mu/sigma subunit domain-containing protein n=1 Tax=Reticulomyxa filosa TaxID=46433 RepID=X6PAE0_RETFI|nr:hypothetical protein RFI_01941 [Reticulomyxa filosa]|eukprot:ETO35131.1 hypothetical protein RFI_01941 [Reticulomyxa filosa]